MTDRSSAVAVRPIWMKQAEEAKQKNEAEKAAAAKAAFEATFKAVDKTAEKPPADDSSDSDAEDESEDIKNKPVGPVDPSKCTAAGAGIAGGTACAPSSFVITTKDSDGRKILTGGAQMKVRISPGVGVGGPDQDGMLKDLGDGTYTVTYAVPKRGNYMVHVECNGRPIMGSPFPVFFSAGTPGAGLLGTPTQSPFPNLVNQTMPNMPNYAGSVSGAFPGLLGMIPGVLNGASGGAILPGVGASLGEVCREYLNGRCSKSDCKFNHPPHNLLMTALAATTTMGTLSQVPMAPSAAAMAAAQAIVAAQALQAHAAQVQAQAQTAADSGSPDKAGKADALKKTLQVSNLSPLLTADQLKQLFSYCGTVVECSITDSKHFGYIEYSKPEEATAALALNNMDVGGRPLNVEMAKSLPSKTAIGNPMHQSSLPMVMQQAVAMQQMQFQQALMMQQTMASQQAASRAATMKSATEMASARAAEISKKLKADGVGNEDKEGAQKSRSPSTSRPRSKSRSRSPIKYRRSRRSRSFSPPVRYPRDRRSRSPFRSRHHKNHVNERRPYRDVRDSYSRGGRRNWDRERELEQERSRDHYSSVSRRHRSRSMSPRTRRSSRAGSASPKRHRESVSPRMRKSSRAASKSPRHHRESRSSPRRNHEPTSHRSRRSRSKSAEGRHRSDDAKDMGKSGKSKQDHGKLAKSRDDVEEPDLFVKDLEDSMEGRTTDSPTPTHKESSLFPEDRALKDEKDVSKSAEGRHHSDDVKDTKKSGKSKPDHRELNKSREDVEEPDLVVKDPEDLREDRATDLPPPTHKKSPLLPEDRAFKDEKDASKHETCGLDDGNSAKTEAAIKNEDLLENSSMDLLEDKRSASPPISKSRKESSASAGDRPRTGSDDLGRRNKLSREYRKRERIDSIREQDSLADDLSRHDKLSPEYRKRERTDSVREQDSLVDGLARRDKLSPEYRKRERADSTRERDSLVDDSKYSREDRRASDSSKSRSHRRSLKPLEDGSSRGKDDRNRREESKREYVKHDKTHTVRKERNYLDYDSSDSREDRKVSSSKRKTHVRSSPSLEDGTSRDRNRREESKREHVKHEKTRPVTKERDYLEYDSSDSREDRRVSSSKRKTRRRSSPLLEDGTSRDRRDRKDRNRHEMSRRETRKSARADHSTKMEDFNDGNLEGSRQDEKVPYSSKLSTQKRDSMSEDDVTSMDVKDLSGCEVADRKLAKTDSIIKEQDCIGQDSADLTGDRVSDFPELMVQGSSTPDGGRSRGAKGRSRHEKSMSEEGKFEKTCNVKGRDYSDDDSVDSREDRKAAKSPISKAKKRSSMSPKDRNSMGTEDEKPRKKPKLEHESVSGFGVSLARDDDEYGFHDGSPSLHVGNYQDSAKLSSPSPSSNDHI